MTEPWGGTDLPSALKGAFRCCGGACPLLHRRLKGTASTMTSEWEHSSGILGLPPNMVGAPKHKKVLLHQRGAPKCNGMLLVMTDAASCSGVLLAPKDAPAPEGCSWPQSCSWPQGCFCPQGCSWPRGCSHPRGARRGAAGQAQGAVDSCQLLPQTLHFPLRRLRPLQENRTAIRPGTSHPTQGPGSAPVCAFPEHSTPTASIINPTQEFKLPSWV